MQVWVVRHGEAGRKGQWPGDDDQRPLDEVGVRQARTLARVLGSQAPRRLRSSPARRCVDTLAPLGERLGLGVQPEPGLNVDRYPGGLLALLADTAMPGDVVCTHGEVMRPALEQLRRGGATVVGDADTLLAKGAVWHLDLDRLVLRPHPLDERLPPVLAAAGVGAARSGGRPPVMSPARAARAVRGSWRAR